MRLEEVRIDDYGPFEHTLEFGDGLEVVYGPNESGKTLLLDALLLMLTGQNDDDRVNQAPVGYVRVHEEDGSHRLDEDETILDRLDERDGIALGAREFRNTFVVRSADSQLSDEDDYYDRATDVVAESLVDDIDRVCGAIRKRGRVTPTGLLINQQDTLKTRTHYDTAQAVQSQIVTFVEDAREEGVHTLEADLFETEQQVAHKRAEIERLDAARRRQEYREQSRNREELEAALEKIEACPDDDDLESLAADVEDALESADQMDDTETRRDDAQAIARQAIAATAIAIVAALVVGGWMLAAIGPSLLGFGAVALGGVLVGAVPAAIGAYFWHQRQVAEQELTAFKSERTAALQRGRELGIDANGLQDLASSVADQRGRLEKLRGTVSTLHGELRGALSLSTETVEETLERATEELARRESELDGVRGTEYSPEDLEEATSELEVLEADRDDIRAKLEQARDDIQSFGEDVDELPFTEYGLDRPRTDIQTLEGLEVLSARLDELIETIDSDAHNAQAADAVLQALKEDEQRRVEELFFGTESTVSEYFSAITDERYESVHYDEGDNELRVRLADGSQLMPNHLSQSTFDQLYFAVRVSFAQELLDDVRGFLLLDDAFLAADGNRLGRQAEILTDLVADGWQVVYFTAQEAHQAQLMDVCDAVVHTLDPLG